MSNPFALLSSRTATPRAPRPPRPQSPLQQMRVRSAAAGYRKALRAEALRAYGSKCACCAESRPAFLIFEYVASLKAINGQKPLKDLKRDNWPSGAATIKCFNCHLGARIAGRCPHETDARRLKNCTRPPAESVVSSPVEGKGEHDAGQFTS